MKKSRVFVNLGELSEELNASRATVRRWLDEDGVSAYVFGGGANGTIRYRRADVDDWLEEAQEGADGEDGEAEDGEDEDGEDEDGEDEDGEDEDGEDELDEDELDDDEDPNELDDSEDPDELDDEDSDELAPPGPFGGGFGTPPLGFHYPR